MIDWGYVTVADSTVALAPGIFFVSPSVYVEMTQVPLEYTVVGHPYMGSIVVVQMVVVPELVVHAVVEMVVADGDLDVVLVVDMLVAAVVDMVVFVKIVVAQMVIVVLEMVVVSELIAPLEIVVVVVVERVVLVAVKMIFVGATWEVSHRWLLWRW